jgi:hypothetical protein
MKLKVAFCALLLAIPLSAFAQQNSVAGTWQTVETVPLGPYRLDLKVEGSDVKGTISQAGRPVPIYDVTRKGGSITFKVDSPDGDRVVTFIGKVTGDVIAFTRTVKVRPGGRDGGPGFLGVSGVSSFTVKRTQAEPTK